MASSLSGVEAVLFDAVGTLMYPDPPVIEVYQGAGAAFGVELSREEIARRFRAAFAEVFADSRSTPTSHDAEHAKWRQVVARVFAGTSAPIDPVFDRLWRHFGLSGNWSLFDDVASVWRELRSRGYLLGVASNYDDRLPGVIRGLPPVAECEQVFWSSRVGFAKPHPQFFAQVAAALAMRPGKILLVGDDWENDVVGASGAGWQAVYLNRKPSLSSPSALASLEGLLDLLD